MSTGVDGSGLPAKSIYSGTAVRSSVSGASDVPGGAHKHISPHIGQIDSGKELAYRRPM